MGFGDGSGISWTICKQSASRFRQITTPAPHHSIFTGQMLFLMPNQQCQSSKDSSLRPECYIFNGFCVKIGYNTFLCNPFHSAGTPRWTMLTDFRTW